MPNHPTLSTLSDPLGLAKLQILVIPVQIGSGPLTESSYTHWSSLIKRHSSIRTDEVRKPSFNASGSSHTRGGPSQDSRLRFFPSTATSVSRVHSTTHIHLSFPSHPPARHLYPLSLLRLTDFPLVVIGIASDQEDAVKGYAVNGDLGETTAGSSSTGKPINQTPETPGKKAQDIFEDTLRDLFPPSSAFPLVKRLVMIPRVTRRSSSPNVSPNKKNGWESAGSGKGKERMEGDVRWALAERAEAWVAGLMSEVIGEVLGEFGELATALETPQGLKTLSATLLPSLTSALPNSNIQDLLPSSRGSTPTELPKRSSTTTPSISLPSSQSLDHLTSAGMGISLRRALTPGGRPTSVQAPSLPPIQINAISSTSASPTPIVAPVASSSNPFRRSTAITSPFSRTSSAASIPSGSSTPTPSNQKYTTATLSGVGGGRLMKILGDMYLLVGMYGDAIKCYEDGAEKCRVVGDVLWEAVAREGRAAAGVGEAWEGRDGSDRAQSFSNSPIPVEILAHYLSALACLSRAPLPYPPIIHSPAPHAASGSLTIPAPTSNNAITTGTGEGLLAYLYTGLSLRISHFLLMIWICGGWGSIALSSLMTHTFPRSYPGPLDPESEKDVGSRRRRSRYLSILSAKSGLSRNSIFAHIEGCLGPHHRAMTKTEQLGVHVEAIWLSRWLDLPRREAALIREVVKRVGVMVVEGREEARRIANAGFSHSHNQRRRPESISLTGGHDPSVGLGMGLPGLGSTSSQNQQNQNVVMRRKESTEGNESLMKLFSRACNILGIELLSFDDDEDSKSASTTTTLPEHRPPRFGWAEIQVETLKEGIAVAEALPDHPAVIKLCLSTLRNLYPYLNPNSQGHLSKMYPSALSIVRRRGLDFGMGNIKWWIPGRVVLSLEVGGLAVNRLPREHFLEEIEPVGKKKDLFLYNPRLKAAESGKTILVANEQVDVFVTLQNPFTFDLEFANLSLITTGATFTTSPLPLVLPASSVQTVRVSGIASSPGGPLLLKGVALRLPDGAFTEILLPVIDDTAKKARDKRRSRFLADYNKVKRSGIDARFPVPPVVNVEENRQSMGAGLEDKWLDCKVVPEQPLLWVKKTSLTHGTVMLYNGESSIIRIVLENSSSVPVDFVKLSFEDSTIREAQAVLNEGELSPEQAYELDWDLANRPVLVWEQSEISIPPGGRATLSVRCLGKVGCTDGLIRIDYGYVNRGDASVKDRFHTRQIVFPVLFTVYHTLELHDLDIIPLSGTSSPTQSTLSPLENGGLRPNSHSMLRTSSRTSISLNSPRKGSFAAGEDELRRRMEEESDDAHCLISLGVRNIYGVPFEVNLTRIGNGIGEDEPLVATRLVPPGATERVIIPFPRILLPGSVLDQRIPSISDRQYIVEKYKKSVGQVKREQELFWYREELLKQISVTWVEPGSHREGSISLRDQILTSDMLEILRLDQVEVRVVCQPRLGGSLKVMEFNGVKITVINRLERPFRPFVHLDPSHDLISRRTNSNVPIPIPSQAIFDGTLSATLDLLSPGESTTYDIGVLFLASGQYGFQVAVEEVLDAPQVVEGNGVGKVYYSAPLQIDIA